MILGIVVMTFFIIIKFIGFNVRLFIYALLVVLMSILLINIPVVSKKIDLMAERQKTENLNNSDYIRVIQFVYFTTQHFKSTAEYIMGSGLPQVGNHEQNIKASAYGNYMSDLVVKGINWVDWGLISMSWVIGILPVLTMIFISLKMFFTKVDQEYFYLGVWFLFLLIVSFTTMEMLRAGNLAIYSFCFVLMERIKEIKSSKRKFR